jgi:hypothetical protein
MVVKVKVEINVLPCGFLIITKEAKGAKINKL